MTSPAPYVSIAEAARLTGTSTTTVRRWLADGRLVGHRFSERVIRVRRDDLDDLAVRTDSWGCA